MVKLPELASTDKDRARVVLVVVGTLSVIAVMSVLAIIILVALQRPVASELYTLTGSVVTGLLAMLVKTSSTEGQKPVEPTPVTVADEPLQVQEVGSSAQWDGQPVSSSNGGPASDREADDPAPTQRLRPTPYPTRRVGP